MRCTSLRLCADQCEVRGTAVAVREHQRTPEGPTSSLLQAPAHPSHRLCVQKIRASFTASCPGGGGGGPIHSRYTVDVCRVDKRGTGGRGRKMDGAGVGQEEKGKADTLSRPCGHRGVALPFPNLPSSPHLVSASGGKGQVGALCLAQARVLTAHFPLLPLLAV